MGGRRQHVTLEGVDDAGMLVSLICLVHCLAAPVLLVLTPVIGAVFADPAIHQLLALLALGAVALALIPPAIAGQHWGVVVLGAAGATLLLVSAFCGVDLCCSLIVRLGSGQMRLIDATWLELAALAATPLGCLLIGFSHWLNRRRQRRPDRECCGSTAALSNRPESH